MKDDPDAMLRDSLIICACFWGAMLALAFLAGCTPTIEHQVTSPQLERLEATARTIIAKGCDKPTLVMPPIPQDVVLDIKGDQITANAGGETLVRYYSRARQLLKPAAPNSTGSTIAP